MPLQGLYPPFVPSVTTTSVAGTTVIDGITAVLETLDSVDVVAATLQTWEVTLVTVSGVGEGTEVAGTVDCAGRLVADICVVRGDTKTQRFTLTDSLGAPVDLSLASAKLAVNPEPEPADTSGQLFEILGVIAAPLTGVIDFTVSALQADQEPETYYYDVQVSFAGGTVVTVATGKWTVFADIADAGV